MMRKTGTLWPPGNDRMNFISDVQVYPSQKADCFCTKARLCSTAGNEVISNSTCGLCLFGSQLLTESLPCEELLKMHK